MAIPCASLLLLHRAMGSRPELGWWIAHTWSVVLGAPTDQFAVYVYTVTFVAAIMFAWARLEKRHFSEEAAHAAMFMVQCAVFVCAWWQLGSWIESGAKTRGVILY